MVKKYFTPVITKKKISDFKKKYKFIFSKFLFDYKKNTPINLKKTSIPYPPNIAELYFLYEFTKINKRLTVLEFGSGWSTLFFKIALAYNKKNFKKKNYNLIRGQNKFELFILENEKKYLNLTKNKISKFYPKCLSYIKTNFKYSDVNMTIFENRVCNEYENLPLCNPDLIYLDGPDQFKVKGCINGISISHEDMMPMNCDILKIEFFLKPGTIVIIDGRGANFQFLRSFLKREWIYSYISSVDKYIMYLNAKSLGKANTNSLKFYKGLLK